MGKDQPTDNLCKASSDDPGEKMVYLFQLLPTYLLHLTYGISLGFPSILVPQLSEQKNSSITLSPASEGLVVSLDYASTVLISFAAGQMQAKVGPIRATLLACPPILLAWVSIACATSLPFIYISRFLVGIGNGILLSSVYSVEIASPEKRGAVVMVELIFRCLGLISIALLGFRALLHWKTISFLLMPLPTISFI